MQQDLQMKKLFKQQLKSLHNILKYSNIWVFKKILTVQLFYMEEALMEIKRRQFSDGWKTSEDSLRMFKGNQYWRIAKKVILLEIVQTFLQKLNLNMGSHFLLWQIPIIMNVIIYIIKMKNKNLWIV
ncbi:hypothetical protein IMG5_023560 [Ichthyophthirius multifiliis]|uniref:Transmembrane protein n=1 Tax=Ichthyophthirius multifiliis TaxID=5932 RepID=G0QKY1_ICHMU|nr:hypothetical protein IMG5_023560 [Ichthyophthirius multifiliis]EGR34132.1 hypothetical protein IMG5_023560 [Ichthyophthirius multifiliis]|eukprot:XP_004039436.1 hypothetical protein IMG5_023560 [Ichthyophthirius multifiliis]